ncbi:MAG: glycoside hydrolase family 43 protein [Planctomycetia bacterium]|nr:glycoside hydrolase family 43 protein [Planctomycetia bacterium]
MKTICLCIILMISGISSAWATDLSANSDSSAISEFPLTNDEIRIRDPFILVDREKETYYMYAQAGNRSGSGYKGVEVYIGKDLKNWSQPIPVLVLPKTMNVRMVWAPEVHYYNNAYYLFVTLTFSDKVETPAPVEGDWPPMFRRGTWIFKSESPVGPFHSLKSESHTPSDQMALDGTLWVEKGIPYMIYCHEWVQLIDGVISYIPLKNDLSDINGEPQKILNASSAPGAIQAENQGKVTDGPFLYKSPQSGNLYMIWSTFLMGGRDYAVLLTRSESGRIDGPWTISKPIFTQHGGHGMIFESLDGKLFLALHQPNSGAPERFRALELIDDGETLRLSDPIK